MNEFKSNIIKTLLYFDIFNYPITMDEIINFMPMAKGDEQIFKNNLNELVLENYIFQMGDFYCLKNGKELVEKRLVGNNHAQLNLQKAYKNSELIGAFPYVVGVCISGSLSKGYMDESGDIDYFIITKPERLWIARTLLILYKKIFLFNSRKHFCVNYFIDTNNLEIPDKNIFTATEVLTLIPTYNHQLFHQFVKNNTWAYDYLPNKELTERPASDYQLNPFKKFTERILNHKIGDYLDNFFMKITIQKWKSKFKHLETENFELALRSRKYVSKHHPQSFQKKVLTALDKGVYEFELKHNIKLNF
ncbi:MAG: nucleotidyltransferase domain-containing protein [Bacteroidia bacterium]|nr:nucleotidyltransferase domain-containing protein [Bacteroidia bacterium]